MDGKLKGLEMLNENYFERLNEIQKEKVIEKVNEILGTQPPKEYDLSREELIEATAKSMYKLLLG